MEIRNEDMNVAIIGGGPAGLLAGILLAREGIQTTIIDRKIWPIDKVCGEGIMPLGVSILEKYDLLKFIDTAFSREFLGVRYFDQTGVSAYGKFRGQAGLVVRRVELSRALYLAARAEDNLRLVENVEFRSFTEEDGLIHLKLKDLRHSKSIEMNSFTYLIGADGLKSKVREFNLMFGKPPGIQPLRMGARVHYEVEAWDKLVQVHWRNSIECYVAPTSNSCVEFNFGWDHKVLQPQKGAQSLEEGLFSHFPELQERIANKKALGQMSSWGPLPNRASSPLKGRVALIGDASFFYDQITGEGLTLAFLQAEFVALTIRGWDCNNGREEFKRKVKSLADHYILITGFAMFFTRHSFIRSLMIRFLSRSPELFSHLLHMNMGEYSFFRPPIRIILKAIFCHHRLK